MPSALVHRGDPMTAFRFLALAVIALNRVVAPADAIGQLVPLGPEFQANMYTTSSQIQPGGASGGLGTFGRAWASVGCAGTDTDYWSVQGQRFDASGTT